MMTKFHSFTLQIRKIEEEKRLEQEKKDRKKQKEKERKERLKAEGKLLTPKQKQDLRRAQGLLEHLKVSDLEQSAEVFLRSRSLI